MGLSKFEKWKYENRRTLQDIADELGCAVNTVVLMLRGNFAKAIILARRIEIMTQDENGKSQILLRDLVPNVDKDEDKKSKNAKKKKPAYD